TNAVAAAVVANAQTVNADAELTAAHAEYDDVQAQIQEAYVSTFGNVAQLAAEKMQYQGQLDIYKLQTDAASKLATDECSDAAMDNAVTAGYSYTGSDLWVSPRRKHNTEIHLLDVDNKSWSPGAWIAQIDKCNKATDAYNLATKTLDIQKSTM